MTLTQWFLVLASFIVGGVVFLSINSYLRRREEWAATQARGNFATNMGEVIPAPDNSAARHQVLNVVSDLKLRLYGANAFVLDARPTLTGIAIETGVWNVGTPCAAVEWKLSVTTPDGREIPAQTTAIPETLTLRGPPDTTLNGANDLTAKSRTAPIGTTPIIGTLLFYVGIPKPTVLMPETILAVTVTDIYGRSTTAKQTIGDWLGAAAASHPGAAAGAPLH